MSLSAPADATLLVLISLKDNNLTDYGKDMSGIIQIAEVLKVNKTLQSIEYAAESNQPPFSLS